MNKIINNTKNEIWFSNSCGGDIDLSFQDYIVQKYYKKLIKVHQIQKYEKCSDMI